MGKKHDARRSTEGGKITENQKLQSNKYNLSCSGRKKKMLVNFEEEAKK